jgi:hypothetical protein
MRKLLSRTSCCLIVFFMCLHAAAQDQRKVSANFNNADITVLARELEQQTGFYFFYDVVQFDSARFNVSVTNETLQKTLELAFQHTDFRFSILEEQKQVFLTKGIEIKTELPAGFFAGAAKDTASNVPEFGDRKAARLDASIESKLFDVGIKGSSTPGAITVVGYVRNIKSGEPVVGATVYQLNTSNGTSTDQYGYYSITLPRGRTTLIVQGIGMTDTRRQVMVYSNGKLDIDMTERVISLREVIVSAQKRANVRNVTMGTERLTMRAIKQVPSVFGEADILKAVLTLPGVKTVGEASTGFNVRGGSADQNLILFNDLTIYNPTHFFGFFSAFNPDLVKEVELYKSSIPSKFGGRLSSVLDISSREGNKKNFAGTAGIGILTSRFNIEGPIKKDKTSFILGGRTTYASWLLNLLPDEYENSKASFYDVNLIISHQVNNKNSIYFTGYISGDRFNLNSDTSYGYNNANASIKWKHIFNNKLTGIFTGGYDRYDYDIKSEKNKVNAYKLGFDINQLNLKADFTHYASAVHTVDFGVSTIRYKLHPGSYGPAADESLIVDDVVEAEQAQETAVYLSDRWTINNNLSLHAGVRYSMYNYLGPKNVNQYAPNLPKTVDNIQETKNYSGGKFIHTYHGPEFRLSARYLVTGDFSIKAGFNSLRQYIHVLSNTTAISPTDIWKLSDPNIRPQFGYQVSFGLYKNWKNNSIETSVEVYAKRIRDYLDYKSGAVLVLNHHIETDVINTKGKAYGMEFMVKKQNGKLNGWLSYTYSRILLKMDDANAGELINRGEYYPAAYDKPHDVTLAGNYRFSHRFSVSINATYSTGRPITLPIGRYFYGGSFRALYSDRNAYRIPDYFRSDFAMNIEGNHKVHQKTHNSWTIGLYNITGRKNPYSVYFVSEAGVVNGYKLSIFGNIIPFVNYNIRF